MNEKLKRIAPMGLLALLLAAGMLTDPKIAGSWDLQGRNAANAGEEKADADKNAALYPIQKDAFFLDTFCSLTIYAGGGEAALSAAMEKLSAFDDLFNLSKESSDVWRINHRSEARIEIDAETARMLNTVKPIDTLSGGDFDITVGHLTALWDFDHRKEVPDAADIRAAMQTLAPGAWQVVTQDGVSYFEADPSVHIDVGAFAKGYIADRLKEELTGDGVTSAIINLGGNVLCVGEETPGTPFLIGLRKPEQGSSEFIRRLKIDDLSVVTAGIYERYFEQDGVHYHHILDPKTGYSVQNELSAVTVVGPESEICDALCTTLLIKGTEAGTKFLAEYNAQQLEAGETAQYAAFFIDRSNAITMTEGAETFVYD